MQLVESIDVKKQTEQVLLSLKICDCIGNSKESAVRKRADFYLGLLNNLNCTNF